MSVNWKHLFEVDFNSEHTLYWVIDTRDFHVNCISNHYMNKPEGLPDLEKLKKYPNRFFSDPDKMKRILINLYEKSGGEGEWRFISFKNQHKKKTDNWQLKYLFVFKTDYGLLICDKDKKAVRKDLFEEEIDEDLLAHQ